MFFAGWLVEKAAFIQENAAVFCDEVELLGAPDPPSIQSEEHVLELQFPPVFLTVRSPTQIAASPTTFYFFFLVA